MKQLVKCSIKVISKIVMDMLEKLRGHDMYLQKGDYVDICCGDGVGNGRILGVHKVIKVTPRKITLSDKTEWKNEEYGKVWKSNSLWGNYILKTREKTDGLRT